MTTPRRLALLVLEYAVGAAMLYWLFHRKLLDLTPLATLTPPLAVSGIALAALMLFLASLRLRSLLREQGIAITVMRCCLLNCLGMFYSLFLPGGVSGDAARAYYLLRGVDRNRPAVLGSLILDRVLGVLAMIALGIASSALLVSSLPWLLPYFLALCALFAAGLGFVTYLARADAGRGGRRAEGLLARALASVHNLAVRLNVSAHSRKTLAYAAGLSLVIHVLAVLLIYMCATHAASGLGLLGAFSVGPFGLLANAIPISPGGLGVGEQTFEFLFHVVGARNGASSFLAARLFLYSPAVVGAGVAAILFLRLHWFLKWS